MRATILATVFALSAVVVLAQAMPASVRVTNGILTDAKSMTLYTFDNDKEANKSTCIATCLNNWPVLKADASDKDMGDWKVITRDDGAKQLAYKGKPLYYFSTDKAPGDKNGDGRGMVWHIAKP